MISVFFPFLTARLVLSLIFCTSLLQSALHAQGKPGTQLFIPGTELIIPVGGNTWSNNPNGGKIARQGIIDWTSQQTWFSTYVRVSYPVQATRDSQAARDSQATRDSQAAHRDSLHLWLRLSVPEGKSRISVTLSHITKELDVAGTEEKRYYAGSWAIPDTGYLSIQFRGILKSGKVYAAIQQIESTNIGNKNITAYVPNDEGNFFYWGRRGPSVHLNYPSPAAVNAEWFYNEITVPEGQDVQGSYFMADGFGQGYFGMQVNSPTERHILFSVWSPFQTDDPKAIPDSQQILLVKKGDEVHAGSFGDEGAGGQSWLDFQWKTSRTYGFLLQAKPLENNYTRFTAWFFAPEKGKWILIASFKRPQTHTWLTGLHSFLENFEPEKGDLSRCALFSRQWIRSDLGQWIPLTKAKFTGDNTARKGYRMDYEGGSKNDAFYLRNGGFFNSYSPLNTWLERSVPGDDPVPVADLSKLP